MAGPSEVYICHLCIALCNEILAHDAASEGRPAQRDDLGPDRPVLIRTLNSG